MSSLLERLRAKDKKGLFEASQVSVSYPSGFAPLDYLNGQLVQVRNLKEELQNEYPSIGIVGGTFNTVVGKSGTSKTTWTCQTAFNIVKPFNENSFVLMYDLEQSLTYTRVKNITGASQEELDKKFIIKQGRNYIEDIYDAIIAITKEKEENKADYLYDPGLRDEFDRPIKAFVPTVIIIDSIPTMSTKDALDTIEGQTAQMRKTKAITQFYQKLMPVIKPYNIIIFVINHIQAKIEINPFAKTQPQLMYMKADESMPCGNAVIYYANNLFKFVSAGKLNEADDGISGANIRIEMLKSRTNRAGQMVTLVYDQVTGFDPVMSLLKFADDRELIEGRNPYRKFIGCPDVKFDTRKFRNEFYEREEVRKALYEVTKPSLYKMLSRPVIAGGDTEILSQEDVIQRLVESQNQE